MPNNKLDKLIVILLVGWFIGSASASAAESLVSTPEAVDQIQKTLLFSDPNAALQKSQERKSSININRGDSGGKSHKSSVDILMTNPGNIDQNSRSWQKERLAYSAALNGEYEAAIEIYKQLLKSNPRDSYIKFSLAVCYQKLGQYDQAKVIYYQLLKDNPNNHDEIIANLLEVIIEQSPNDAVYLLAKLSVENPSSAYILASSAMAYDKINKSEQAILLLNRAISIDPEQIKYKFNLAIIYDKAGDYSNAVGYYQDVLKNYLSKGDIDNSIPIEQVKQRIEFIKSKLLS